MVEVTLARMTDAHDPQKPNFSFVKKGDKAPAPDAAPAAPDPMFSKEQAFFDDNGQLVKELDSAGVPRIPGTDDRTERHPFGYMDPDDPDHEAMLGELQPATAMNLVCMVGPCEHYREVIIDEPTADAAQWSVLRRICRHYQDHESDWDLSEEQIQACSAYDPPWWSLRGRLRKLINRSELALARNTLSPDWGWFIPELAFGLVVSKSLGLVKLYPDRKHIDIARSEEPLEEED
jgi:hypothetical protein